MTSSNIKVIGFDLDQTLYPKSPIIDEAIQGYIYKKIADHKKISLNEAEKLFKDLYREGKGLSGRKTLLELRIPEAEEIVQEALENANIDEFLTPDKEVLDLLEKLRLQFHAIDLITGSDKKITEKKLEKMGIKDSVFSHIITASDASKSDKSAFMMWLSFYPELIPEDFLYIGDRSSTDYIIPKEMGIHSILVNVAETDPFVTCPQLKKLTELSDHLFL